MDEPVVVPAANAIPREGVLWLEDRTEELRKAGVEPEAAYAQALVELSGGDSKEQKRAVAAAIQEAQDAAKLDKPSRNRGTGPATSGIRRDEYGSAGGGGNLRKDVLWVYERIEVPEDRLDRLDAPGPGAWGMLKYFRRDRNTKADFYSKLLPKVLPSEREMETMQRFDDDGREVISLIARVRKARAIGKEASTVEPATETPSVEAGGS